MTRTNEDIYELLIQQFLPSLKTYAERLTLIDARLARLNGSVEVLQEASTQQKGCIQAHQEEIARINSRVSVLEALGEERKQHQKELLGDIKEEQKKTWQQVVDISKQVIDVSIKVAGLAALGGLVLRALGIM